jgi:uncharacterized protein YdeI (BOF family)
MKKFLLALMIGLFSVSAFAMHHEGKAKHKTAAHKKHKQHKKSKHKQ